MPTIKVLDKEAITVFARDSKGNKVVIKSGKNKGEYKKIIKSPAKYHRELAVHAIKDYLEGSNVIVIEEQGKTSGNSARSSKTTSVNFGKILAIAELSGAKVIRVSANKWKKYFNLSDDKLLSVELAEKLYPHISFRTARGALRDGPSEAILIREHELQTKDNK